ncbi:MAG: hypothetical protein EU547_02875 [Promethearchaeota archaeon]|nr:MAG: hypothetical protein EU547_02875 [Candidatus Lokiarchaeota archaeon]
MTMNIIEEIKSIENDIEDAIKNDIDKQNFFKIVNFIKVHQIKEDEILSKISKIRRKMSLSWRPKQFSILSGVILWLFLVLLGAIFIFFTFFIDLKDLIALGLYIFCLIFGWLSINVGIHNLGHYIAGKIVGIEFNSWVIRHAVFQWALIIDYYSYLKSSFRKRQILHLSGPICTLSAPWVIYFITLSPIMIGIGIYMFVASLPVIIKKKWDYGRIFKERELKKQARELNT